MSAQRELAALIHLAEISDHARYVRFIRDHGPAISELIEDAQYALSSLSGQDYKRLRDTLAKLTEPKA